MARLRRITEDGEEVLVDLAKDHITLGRADECDVVVTKYADVSREHCGLHRYDDGVWTVTDFGSRNGTFVNDEQIFEETALAHGDRIRLCRRVSFVFEQPPTEAESKGRHKDPNTIGQTTMFRAADAVEKELANKSFHSLMEQLVADSRKIDERDRRAGRQPSSGEADDHEDTRA